MSDPRVALVGDDGTVERAATDAGLVVTDSVGSADADRLSAEGFDAVVAVGERALIETTLGSLDTPVVPVDGEEADYATEARPRQPALDALAAGTLRTVEQPILSVAVGGERVGRAVLDTTLVTSEPARISEYSIHDGGERVDTIRSDGIVVSTPLGSSGYGRAADGPILAPGTGLAVSPIAPFATASNARVLAETVKLRVERDEGDVSLLLDDRDVQRVPSGTPVVIDPAERVRIGRPRESRVSES